MNRYRALLGVGMLLVAAIAAPAAAFSTDRSAEPARQLGGDRAPASNDSSATPAPGAQFSAAVEVHEAEVDAEVDGRAFGIAMDRAGSNRSKAAVVDDRVQVLTNRLAELRAQERRLVEAYQSGNVSEARYRAEASGLAARMRALSRQANATAAATDRLPRDVLESRGIDVAAIETLRRNASSMTGPEVAEIAKTIGGPGVGGGPVDGRRGPPTDLPPRADRNGSGPPTAGRSESGWTPTLGIGEGTLTLPSPTRNRTSSGPPETPASSDPGNGPDGRRGGPSDRPDDPQNDDRSGGPGR